MLSGNRSGKAALRREQREQLESITMRIEPRGRKARLITDVTSTALGKEMAVRLYKLAQFWTKYINKQGDCVKKCTLESYIIAF
jgi:hypothetical protein